MDDYHLEKTIANARNFLAGHKIPWYHDRKIRFDLDSHYTDFDGMLKREVVHCKFNVIEIACQCRITIAKDGNCFQIKLQEGPRPFFRDPTLEPEAVESILMKMEILQGISKDGAFVLDLPSYRTSGKALHDPASGLFLESTRIQPRFPDGGNPNLEKLVGELTEWSQSVLAIWRAKWRDAGESIAHDATEDTVFRVIAVNRHLTHVDVDSSCEDEPDYFRWQEADKYAGSDFKPLTEAECLEILKRSHAQPPPGSRFAGISKLEIDGKNSCLRLRYLHVIPDPIPAESAPPGFEDKWGNRGSISIENDFWEYHIDSLKHSLVGECRKWRRF